MAGTRVKLLNVESCNLGRLKSGDLALRMNFTTGTEQKGSHQKAVFSLSPNLAKGLASALNQLLTESDLEAAEAVRH